MKKLIISIVLLYFTTSSMHAQSDATANGTHLKDVVNTISERLTLSGYLQTGFTYTPEEEVKNTFDTKRIILMTNAQITDKWSAFFMYNFAGNAKTQEIYTEYAFNSALKARIGQFKTPFTIENMISPTVVELIAPYSQVVNYLAAIGSADVLHGSCSGRDQGVMIYGDLLKRDKFPIISYKLALMNGQGINTSDKNSAKDIIGSLTIQPIAEFGITASFIKGTGNAAVAMGDLKVGDNYDRNRWSIGATVKTGGFNLRTEYLEGDDEGECHTSGGYLTISYRLFPKFDLIASYDHIKQSINREFIQNNYVAGIQYWFYPKCRIQLQYTDRNRRYTEKMNYDDLDVMSLPDLLQMQLQVRF